MNDNVETTELTPVNNTESVRRGRGELGVATAGLTVWQRWKADNSGVSLKRFARQLAKDGDQTAKDWFANKSGAKNQDRSEKTLKRIAEERQATKSAKSKKK